MHIFPAVSQIKPERWQTFGIKRKWTGVGFSCWCCAATPCVGKCATPCVGAIFGVLLSSLLDTVLLDLILTLLSTVIGIATIERKPLFRLIKRVYERHVHCSEKGPYFRDRVPIGTFLTFWVLIGSLFIFQGPYFQFFG